MKRKPPGLHTPPAVPPSEPPAQTGTFSFDPATFSDGRALFNDLAPHYEAHLFTGPGGAGVTAAMIVAAHQLMTGSPVWGRYSPGAARPVLFVTAQSTRGGMRTRLSRLSAMGLEPYCRFPVEEGTKLTEFMPLLYDAPPDSGVFMDEILLHIPGIAPTGRYYSPTASAEAMVNIRHTLAHRRVTLFASIQAPKTAVNTRILPERERSYGSLGKLSSLHVVVDFAKVNSPMNPRRYIKLASHNCRPDKIPYKFDAQGRFVPDEINPLTTFQTGNERTNGNALAYLECMKPGTRVRTADLVAMCRGIGTLPHTAKTQARRALDTACVYGLVRKVDHGLYERVASGRPN